MTQLNYTLKLIFNTLKKNKIVHSNSFVTVFFIASLTIVSLRIYFFFYLFRVIQERENEKVSLLEKLLKNDTSDDLAQLLLILEISMMMVVVASLLYLIFYLYISVVRELLLNDQTLKIKSMLGVSPIMLTIEFYGEFLFVVLFALLLAMLIFNGIYTLIYAVSGSWVTQFLILPINFLIFYDFFYLLGILILLGLLFFFSYKKIRKNHYKTY